jgi:hypothetical protein
LVFFVYEKNWECLSKKIEKRISKKPNSPSQRLAALEAASLHA